MFKTLVLQVAFSMTYYQIYIVLQLLVEAYGTETINHDLWKNLPNHCGLTRLDTKVRIIDGDEAELGQFPWIVRLGQMKKNRKIHFFCGGSLISKYYVISAAHCMKYVNIVRLGENYLDRDKDCDTHDICASPHQDIKLKTFKTTDFQPKTQTNDISLIELEKPAKFNDFVQPVCLPRNPFSHKDLLGKIVTVAGWGLVEEDNASNINNLLYITIPIVNSSECDIVYPFPLKESQFCIGHSEGGKDSCSGDSGGPVTLSLKDSGSRRTYLVAIVSYGLTICGNSVAVYTDVSYFIKWILENIEKK